MANIRPFLRLQNNDYLTALRDKVAADLLANVQFTSVSVNGKSNSQAQHVSTAELAEQLVEVLEERGLGPEDHEPTPRMTLVGF